MKNRYDFICEEVQQVKDSLCSNPSDELLFYYRGHSDIDWDLVPTIIRSRGKVTEYSEICRAMNDGNWSLADSAFVNIARMQHYGYATRFLDYTTSLDVALYFACNDSNYYDRDGCISICLYTNDRHIETPDTLAISELALLASDISLMDFAKAVSEKHERAIEKEHKLYKTHSFLFDEITDMAWNTTVWLNSGFMITPTEDELNYLAKSNPRILRQKGAFFIFGNETTPSKVPTRSSLLDTVMIHPIIKEKSNLIRPDILGNGAINITIRSHWKPEIMKMLEKKGITHEYLFPDEQ